MDDSSHVKPTKMKGTEEVMIFLCTFAYADDPGPLQLFYRLGRDFQHVIVHHLWCFLLLHTRLMSFGFHACLEITLVLGGRGAKAKWPLPPPGRFAAC